MEIHRSFHGGGPSGLLGGHGFGRMFGMGPRGGNGFGGFVVLILFFLVLIAVAWVITRLVGGGPSHEHAQSPMAPTLSAPGTGPIDVLRMRLARGEIDEDEFTSRLRLLQGDPVTQ